MLWLIWLIGLSVLAAMVWAGVSLAPWVPTYRKDLKRIALLLQLKPNTVVYELGCGNGRVGFFLSQSGIKYIGIELAWPLYVYCQVKKFLFYSRYRQCNFYLKDLFKVNLSSAQAVYVYGTPKPLQQRLIKKLKQDLKPGTLVLSYVFPIVGLHLLECNKPSSNDIALYLYRI
ncbi:MAG: class I SAM-dependent methyltransferase [Patescibacteria group bacterium]|jgi:SAM-dependent methyltransferase